LGFEVDLLSVINCENGEYGPEHDHLTIRVRLKDNWLVDEGFALEISLTNHCGSARTMYFSALNAPLAVLQVCQRYSFCVRLLLDKELIEVQIFLRSKHMDWVTYSFIA
jgi:hypothetical protein